MKRVRVLVANRPRLMRELVLATIAEQPDIEIVGEVGDEGDLTEVVEQVRPDVLILSMEEPEKRPSQCGFLLGRYPDMRILAPGRFFFSSSSVRRPRSAARQAANRPAAPAPTTMTSITP